MNLPHFLIIGAARCGTSSLHENLKTHPHLCNGRLPRGKKRFRDLIYEKEMHFFDKESKYARGLEWYAERWDHARPNQLRFESTPNYLFLPTCPSRIAHAIPDGRFIVMLRNPIDRAWSHYHFWKDRHRMGEAILRQGKSEILQKGIYYKQLKRWLCEFPLDRFLIIRSEDYFANPGKVTVQVHKWLGVTPVASKRQVYYDPRRIGSMKRTVIPKPSREVVRYLRRFYAKHNQMLSDLLERDFGWGYEWK